MEWAMSKTKFTKVAVPEDYPGKMYQELFNHLSNEHGLILLESEMSEIIHIVNKMKSPDREDEMREMLEKIRDGKIRPREYVSEWDILNDFIESLKQEK